MIKRVAEEFKGENAKGISFDSFLTFYNVLFGGADLERAMFFLDEEHFGVTRDEFIKVANWVVGVEVDPHVVEVNFCCNLKNNPNYYSYPFAISSLKDKNLHIVGIVLEGFFCLYDVICFNFDG